MDVPYLLKNLKYSILAIFYSEKSKAVASIAIDIVEKFPI
jgi:hypothetical protein